jgi:hypothetical protein
MSILQEDIMQEFVEKINVMSLTPLRGDWDIANSLKDVILRFLSETLPRFEGIETWITLLL